MPTGSPILRYLRRVAVNASAVASVIASANANQVSGVVVALPVIDATQALKIVSIAGTVFDQGESGSVSAPQLNVNLILTNPAATQILIAQTYPAYTSGGLIGKQGMRVNVIDQPVIYGTDFNDVAGAVGATPGRFLLQFGGDFSNSHPVGENVTFNLSGLVELYQLAGVRP